MIGEQQALNKELTKLGSRKMQNETLLKIHKANYKKTFIATNSFGGTFVSPTVLCNTTTNFYKCKLVRNWKDVTCEECLKLKEQY